MNPGDTNSESVAGSLISNGETLQLNGVRVRGLTNVHTKDRKVWVLPEGGGGRSLGTCVLCSLQPRDSVASPCSCRPVPGSGSCDTGDRVPWSSELLRPRQKPFWLALPSRQSPPCTHVPLPPCPLVMRMDQNLATCAHHHAFGDLWTRLLAHLTALSGPTWPRSCPVGPLSLCSAPWGQVS